MEIIDMPPYRYHTVREYIDRNAGDARFDTDLLIGLLTVYFMVTYKRRLIKEPYRMSFTRFVVDNPETVDGDNNTLDSRDAYIISSIVDHYKKRDPFQLCIDYRDMFVDVEQRMTKDGVAASITKPEELRLPEYDVPLFTYSEYVSKVNALTSLLVTVKNKKIIIIIFAAVLLLFLFMMYVGLK